MFSKKNRGHKLKGSHVGGVTIREDEFNPAFEGGVPPDKRAAGVWGLIEFQRIANGRCATCDIPLDGKNTCPRCQTEFGVL